MKPYQRNMSSSPKRQRRDNYRGRLSHGHRGAGDHYDYHGDTEYKSTRPRVATTIRSHGIIDPEQDQASIHHKVQLDKDEYSKRKAAVSASTRPRDFFATGSELCHKVDYHDILIAPSPTDEANDDAEGYEEGSFSSTDGALKATSCVNGLNKKKLQEYRFAGVARGSFDPRDPIKIDIGTLNTGTETVVNTGSEALFSGDRVAWGPPVPHAKYLIRGKAAGVLPPGLYRVSNEESNISNVYRKVIDTGGGNHVSGMHKGANAYAKFLTKVNEGDRATEDQGRNAAVKEFREETKIPGRSVSVGDKYTQENKHKFMGRFLIECMDYDRAILRNRRIGVVTRGGASGDEVVIVFK